MSSFHMDELSIDSVMQEKESIRRESVTTATATEAMERCQQVVMDPEYSREARSSKRKKRHAKTSKRPHFRIDWRQLTYYQKPESYMSRCIGKISGLLWEDKHENKRAPFSGGYEELGPKRILNSLDGCFKSGELSAILGPSGAGKSTFLSTLFGSKQESAFGQTKVTWFTSEGVQVSAGLEQRSIKIAFLPQHDHLLHHLTVYETLLFASKIKNATVQDKGKHFHQQNVKRVAKMLKLTECLDTRCGRLSGGQYKRVSIGQELLSEPDVIILDEPTSGLDAMTCLTTVNTLKSIVTKHPMSIILTIHQPDIDVFNIFDHVYVIAQGGLAIYEGSPRNIVPALRQVNLEMPSPDYNPARFIVENSFVNFESEYENPSAAADVVSDRQPSEAWDEDEDELYDCSGEESCSFTASTDKSSYIRRSLASLTEALSGKEMSSGAKDCVGRHDKRPLLNLGIRTLDGKLITSKQLESAKHQQLSSGSYNQRQLERLDLLKRLNQLQKSRFHGQRLDVNSPSGDSYNSEASRPLAGGQKPALSCRESPDDGRVDSDCGKPQEGDNLQTAGFESGHEKSSTQSDYSSLVGSDKKAVVAPPTLSVHRTGSLAQLAGARSDLLMEAKGKFFGKSSPDICNQQALGQEHQQLGSQQGSQPEASTSASSAESQTSEDSEFIVNFDELMRDESSSPSAPTSPLSATSSKGTKLRRKFDKRLSAKHNCSKQKDLPIWHHSFLLTHRTWLSIVRDPVFFGIQACMHTTIPILLAVIFGSVQEEGCPRVGSFDLVEFAYSDTTDFIHGTVHSIRKSIGNIGIVFFEMFVLSFAINCITALVFPIDMHVLLKEYRNGWYSLRSYFFGRTLADLPVPVVLHSIGISILYFMTGQPHILWRYCSIVFIVIIASLVAQSVGLTIGAILMRSSQSAVLAAAGIVAPFFALSGFIVRIHTLPVVAQIAAQGSYLYHMLNGFIILRYGFGRCQCSMEDFEQNASHQIPPNLHTLASMWIGTYSNEYADSAAMRSPNGTAVAASNRTNVDPNIDIVDKMMHAFKMANSYGHEIKTCDDVLPYAMLDFNLRDNDIYHCFVALIIMLLISRFITFTAIYYKIRSFT